MIQSATGRVRKPKVFLVSDGQSNDRLIRAMSNQGALRHAASHYSARIASQDDIITALGAGIEIEDANSDDETLPLGVEQPQLNKVDA